jgi:hypothetical protein
VDFRTTGISFIIMYSMVLLVGTFILIINIILRS